MISAQIHLILLYKFDRSMLSLKSMQNHLIIEDWGFIHFEEAWKRQSIYQNYLIQRKRRPDDQRLSTVPGNGHFLICCEHPHVYTIGKTGSNDHLLVNDAYLKENEISRYHINRGGDITYHGPGQIVLYPILDLGMFFEDLHRYIRLLEEIVIRTLGDLGRSEEHTSELQSRGHLVCRLLLEKKNKKLPATLAQEPAQTINQ